MRVLFYLPLMTDWFFDDVVKHLIRLATSTAEVHVAIPMPWLGTGLSEHQLAELADLPQIQWHVLDGADHPSLRTRPEAPEDLVAFAHRIAPDYTFCRSADVTTPMLFPGQVRFLMEAAIPPFEPAPGAFGGRVTLTGPAIFDRGELPPLHEREVARLRALAAAAWPAVRDKYDASRLSREDYLRAAGLPTDRRIIAVPLDYEGQANFINEVHRATPHNAQLIVDLAGQIGEDCILALTQHPLNVSCAREIDHPTYPIDLAVEWVWEKARIVRPVGTRPGDSTSSLISHCDGMVLCDSKSLGYGLVFGKPVLRLSRFQSAAWMNTYSAMEPLLRDIRAGEALCADRQDAMTWFAFHYGNEVFAVQDPAFTFDELIERTDRAVDRGRWESGIARWTLA